MINVIHR